VCSSRGAPLLFSAAEIDDADDAGITGTMNGVTFHCYATPSYRMLIVDYGLVLVNVHDDAGEQWATPYGPETGST
jgi:hypothetical protein